MAAGSPTGSSSTSTSRKGGPSTRSGLTLAAPASGCRSAKIERRDVRRLGLQPRDGKRPERLPRPWLRRSQLHRAHLRHRIRSTSRSSRSSRCPGSKVRYTTIQNWSNDVYNLVTKRAHAYENSTVEWIDANTGLAQDGQVPGHLPARRGRHGGHHQRRRRRQGPAPGHRRQGRPPRPEHALADRLASPSPRTAAGPPTAASSRSRRAPPTSSPASAATP